MRPAALAGDRRSAEADARELATGTWEALVEADGVPLQTDDPGFSLDELRAYADVPRDRAVRVTRTRGGLVRIRVRSVVPHAEVAAVHPHDGRIEIAGWLAYTGPRPGESARLLAAARQGEATVTGHARLDGTAFRGRLDVEALAEAGSALWDLWFDIGDVHARLGTWLDDAPGKRGKLSFPRQVVAPAGREVAVRPYYTERDQLSVSCRPLGDGGG
jgi:hypothetical protein